MSALKMWLADYQLDTGRQLAGRRTAADGDLERMDKVLSGLDQELKKIDLQISNTYDLLEQGVYTADVFTSRHAELAARRSRVDAQRSEIRQSIDAARKAEAVESDIIPRFVGLLNAYDGATTAEDKNAMLREMLEKVSYIKENPNTRGNLQNDNFEIRIFPRLTHSDK